MWKSMLLGACLCVSFWQSSATKVCQKYVDGGVTVDYSKNKVTFPAVHNPPVPVKLAQEYDKKGLDAFFQLSASFMNTVQKDELPQLKKDGKTRTISDLMKEVQSFGGDVFKFELPMVITCGIGVLFALLLPLIGCCFCCCRLCNKCGGEKIQSKENAEAHGKCCCFSFTLFTITIFIICGAMMMFVTNNNMRDKLKPENSKVTYNNALDTTWGFLTNVRNQLKDITENKTDCLYEDLIVPDISDQGVKDQVGVKLKNIVSPNIIGALNAVKNATKDVGAMNNSLNIVSNSKATLLSLGDTLKAELDQARTKLNEIKANCTKVPQINQTCAKIDTSGLKQDANFTQLPNIDTELSSIRDILNQNFSGAVDEGFSVLNKIPDTVVDKAQSTLKDIRVLAKDGKDKLKNSTTSLFNSLDDILNDKAKYQNYYTDVEEYIKYDEYRFYGQIGLAGVVTFIALLLSLGLACGICSYKKDLNPVQRTNTSNHGGNCLMAAVVFMFLISFVTFLLTGILFFVGEHLHIMCREMKDGAIIDKYMDGAIKLNGTTLKIKTVLKNCEADMAIYQAIDAQKIYNFDDKLNITKQLNIKDKLDSISSSVDLSDQTILNNKTKKSLEDLKSSSVANINFTRFFEELAKGVVAVDLVQLSNQIKNVSASIRSQSNASAEIADAFDGVANNLIGINNGTIVSITTQTALMKTNVQDLKSLANNLSDTTQGILDKLEKADTYVKTGVSSSITTLITNYVDRVLGWPKQFVDYIMGELKTNVAKCSPIYNIYHGLINVYLCEGIIGNFNGYWVAMGWCCFFFLFAIIFGVKLAKYFRRMRMLAGFDDPDPVAYPGYEQHHVKIPLQEYGGNSAPPPYEA